MPRLYTYSKTRWVTVRAIIFPLLKLQILAKEVKHWIQVSLPIQGCFSPHGPSTSCQACLMVNTVLTVNDVWSQSYKTFLSSRTKNLSVFTTKLCHVIVKIYFFCSLKHATLTERICKRINKNENSNWKIFSYFSSQSKLTPPLRTTVLALWMWSTSTTQ